MEGIVFILICLLSFYFFHLFERANRFNKIYLFLAVFLLCWLSCVRNPLVGTDTFQYINRFKNAGNYGFDDFFLIVWQGRDLLFSAFTYYFSAISGANVYLYLFILEFLCIWPIIVCAKRVKEFIPLDKAMFFYIALIYPASMNIVRETIAAAFFLLAWCMFKEKRYLWTFALIFIGYGFHHSVVLVLLVCVFVELFEKIKDRNLKKILFCVAVLTFVLIVTDTGGILTKYIFADSLISGNKIVDYYGRFQKGSYMIAIGRYGIMDLFYRVVFTLVPLKLIDRNSNLSNSLRTYSIVSLSIYATIFFVFGTTYGYRITFFYDVFNILYFSIITRKRSSSFSSVRTGNLVMNLLAISYFAIIFVYIGANDVMPFAFNF